MMSSLDWYEEAVAPAQRFFRACNDPSFTLDKLPELIDELVFEEERSLEEARRTLASLLYQGGMLCPGASTDGQQGGAAPLRQLPIAPFIDSIAGHHPSLSSQGLRDALVTRSNQDMPFPHGAHSVHIVAETRSLLVKPRVVSSRPSQPYATSSSLADRSRRGGLLRGILHASRVAARTPSTTEALRNMTHTDAVFSDIKKPAFDTGEQHLIKTSGDVHERLIGDRRDFLLGDSCPEPGAATRLVGSITRTTVPETCRDDRRDIINLVEFSPLGSPTLGESSSGAPPLMSPGVPSPSISRVLSRPVPPGYSNYQDPHNSQVVHDHMHIKREPQELHGVPSALPINLDVTRSRRKALPRGPPSQPGSIS
ncbi:hypothetical protein FRC11_008899 [Ceratobasidium sp. 423]|nr:hypothetical protein FRC11_008899 [Ceratobasidium sp. 423]